MKARKLLNETISRLIRRRKESRNYGGGLLGVLMRARGQKIYQLTDSQVVDNLIGVIFAAHDTTASALTWVLKYLHDNVNLLESVMVYNFSHSLFFLFVFLNFPLSPDFDYFYCISYINFAEGT